MTRLFINYEVHPYEITDDTPDEIRVAKAEQTALLILKHLSGLMTLIARVRPAYTYKTYKELDTDYDELTEALNAVGELGDVIAQDGFAQIDELVSCFKREHQTARSLFDALDEATQGKGDA